MKAILKSNRKVIVDVVEAIYVKGEEVTECYYDKHTGEIYHEDELDFVEYYGG